MSVGFSVSSFFHSFNFGRALLYTPSHELKKLQKIPQIKNLDIVCMDLEDGVPLIYKELARSNVLKFLDEKPIIKSDLALRINAIDSKVGLKDLISILQEQTRINTIIIPKSETVDEIKFVNRFLDLQGLLNVKIFALIETPKGLVNVNKIAKIGGHLNGLVFGAEDFKSAAGIAKQESGNALLFARSKIVFAARANNLQSIDMVSLDFRRKEVVENDAKITKSLGFSGKQVIHPMQIEVVNQVFRPTDKEVLESEHLLKIFVKSLSDGKGVCNQNGTMIELPHIKEAIRNLVLSGKSIESIQEVADSGLK